MKACFHGSFYTVDKLFNVFIIGNLAVEADVHVCSMYFFYTKQKSIERLLQEITLTTKHMPSRHQKVFLITEDIKETL